MQLLLAPEATFRDMVDGILVVRFTLIEPLVCHIWPELVELFDAQMKVLLGGEERTPPTGDIVRCMEDRVGAGGSVCGTLRITP